MCGLLTLRVCDILCDCFYRCGAISAGCGDDGRTAQRSVAPLLHRLLEVSQSCYTTGEETHTHTRSHARSTHTHTHTHTQTVSSLPYGTHTHTHTNTQPF